MRRFQALVPVLLMLALGGCVEQRQAMQDKPAPGGIVLVERGQPRAVVVTADAPSRMAAYAVEELVAHVRKATGVALPVAKESAVPEGFAHRIYVGDTQAARRLGIKPDELDFDVSVLRSAGDDLYIVGRELPAGFWGANNECDPLRGDMYHPKLRTPYPTGSGTLFGVYELLERHLGVRWVWPGDLGAYVPRAATIRIPSLDLQTKPKMAMRKFHWPIGDLGAPQPGSFSGEAAWTAFRDAQRVYERRRRQGLSAPAVHPWHFFHWWWPHFGKEHPEWFVMDADGTRGEWSEANRNESRTLCVSNPDLPRFIAENDWDALFAKGFTKNLDWYYRPWYGKTHLDLSEGDSTARCHCPACRALDVTPPPGYDSSDFGPNVSDRYATFWKRVYDLAVQRNPDIKIVATLYWQTFPAPLGDVKLNRNFIGEFAPWTGRMMWMPMPEKSLENMKRQWLGWKRTGMTLRFRPNYMHGCRILPFFSIRQAGEFLKFTAGEGSEGCMYDSLFGHYGVQAMNLYLHMRLMADPDLEVDAVRAEFCSAFGPAAAAVDRYFRYWEEYSEKIVNTSGEIFPQWGPRNYFLAARYYTPEKFAAAAAILDEALAAAQPSPEPEFAQRVEFLQAGLEHARLFAALLAALEWDGNILRPCATDEARFEAAKKAYADLLAFRRAHEHLPIADLRDAAQIESPERGWLALADLGKTFEQVRQAAPRPAPNPWSAWRFRKDPDDVGVKAEWFRPDADAADWSPIAVPDFWDAALGEYIGYGWYRTTFVVPKEWQGERLALEFGAVDEQAWVYVNGIPAGEHTIASTGLNVLKLWDQAFTVEVAPEQLRYGAENTLVVRVHNSTAAGGIHKPVVGHAPHPEKWRPLPGRYTRTQGAIAFPKTWALYGPIGLTGAGECAFPEAFPRQWTLFGPAGKDDAEPEFSALADIPAELTVAGKRLAAQAAVFAGCRLDLGALCGGHEVGKTAYLLASVEAAKEMDIELGAGADWWMKWWVNGEVVCDTLKAGNGNHPPGIQDHRFTARLKAGKNLVVVKVVSGNASFALALGEHLPEPELAGLTEAPAELMLGARRLKARTIELDAARCLELDALVGGQDAGRSAWLLAGLEAETAREIEFGAGADWWMQWWVDGEAAGDTLATGNGNRPPTPFDHRFTARLKAGKNLLAVKVVSRTEGFALALCGPCELAAEDARRAAAKAAREAWRAGNAAREPEAGGRQGARLLIEPGLVEKSRLVEPVAGPVVKAPENPLLRDDVPWEPNWSDMKPSVWRDPATGRTHLWYTPFIHDSLVSDHNCEWWNVADWPPERVHFAKTGQTYRDWALCYAYSNDGRRWFRPHLGLVEWNGSRQNNILLRDPRHQIGPMRGVVGCGVGFDAYEPDPARRFKLVAGASTRNGEKGIAVSYSPDGLNWELPHRVLPREAWDDDRGTWGDAHNTWFYHPGLGRYVAFTQGWRRDRPCRLKLRAESEDFEHWTNPEIVAYTPEFEVHTHVPFLYGGLSLALLHTVTTPDGAGDGTLDVELGVSLDTRTWTRFAPGRCLIPRGAPGQYDCGTILSALAPVVVGDEIRIYYSGRDVTIRGWNRGAWCLATLPRDRWGGYTRVPLDPAGELTTRPDVYPGGELSLNFAAPQGAISVEALDAAGVVVAASGRLRGDHLAQSVRWETGGLSGREGQPLRLRFRLRSATLYAYEWRTQS